MSDGTCLLAEAGTHRWIWGFAVNTVQRERTGPAARDAAAWANRL